MAPPPSRTKAAVDLANGPRRTGSRIRRDPPPPPPKVPTPREMRLREAWTVGIGIVVFALAIAVVLIGLGKTVGWSPASTEIHLTDLR